MISLVFSRLCKFLFGVIGLGGHKERVRSIGEEVEFFCDTTIAMKNWRQRCHLITSQAPVLFPF